jgi:hypothetical protein
MEHSLKIFVINTTDTISSNVAPSLRGVRIIAEMGGHVPDYVIGSSPKVAHHSFSCKHIHSCTGMLREAIAVCLLINPWHILIVKGIVIPHVRIDTRNSNVFLKIYVIDILRGINRLDWDA